MWRDVRYAGRLLWRNPGFAAAAIGSTAFGIAACTAVFSVVNAVLLRPLPVPRPQDLVSIYSLYTAPPAPSAPVSVAPSSAAPPRPTQPLTAPSPSGGRSAGAPRAFASAPASAVASASASAPAKAAAAATTATVDTPTGYRPVSWPDFQDIAARTDLFEAASAYVLLPVTLDAAGASDRTLAEFATGQHHQLLGLRPALGRLLTPDDDRPGAAPVAVISYQLWRDRFGANPAIVGSHVRLNGQPFDIVGVMPESFRTLLLDWGVPGITLPFTQHTRLAPVLARANLLDKRENGWLMVVARLRTGISFEAASAALRAQAQQTARSQSSRDGWTFSLFRTSSTRFWPERRAAAIDLATLLVGSVATLLLIALLNVANLIVARLATRQREISLRLAIGASRLQVARQLAIEGVMLAALGTIASVPLAIWLTQAIAGVHLPFFIKNAGLSLSPDWRMFGGVSLLCGVSGLLLGLLPALRAWRTDVRSGLSGAFGTAADHGGAARRLLAFDMRHALAALQIAICLMLAIAAGLMGRSLAGLVRADLGFDSKHITLLSLSPGTLDLGEARGMSIQRELLARVRRQPGVEAAAFARTALPSAVRTTRTVTAASPTDERQRTPQAIAWNQVSPGFFETVRMPLVAGRDFRSSDDPAAPPVAILNETAARRFWGAPAAAVGQTMRVAGDAADRIIVGVVRDAVYREVGEAPRPYLFLSTDQTWAGEVALHVRAPRGAGTVVEAARRELRLLDSTLAFTDVRTLDDLIALNMAAPRLSAGLAIGAGLAGLALALFGLYTLLAFLVAQRRAEIAIRIAIGASPRQVLALVAGFGLRVTLAGLAIGLAATLSAAHLLTAQLRGVSPYDTATYALVTALVLASAAVACLLPARRAAGLDPWKLLRR